MTHSNFRLKEGFTCEGFHSQQKGAMSGNFQEGSHQAFVPSKRSQSEQRSFTDPNLFGS